MRDVEASRVVHAEEWRLGAAILLAGSAIGLMGGLFLLLLRQMDRWRNDAVALVAQAPAGWAGLAVTAAAGVVLAAWLARRYAPHAPQVPGKLEAEADPPLHTIGVNATGTAIAVGSGLALGPERPAMQMARVLGNFAGRLTRLTSSDRELLAAACSGAGVATMFNAPLGCAAYAHESILKKIDQRSALTTLGTGAVAVATVRVLLGPAPNYSAANLPDAGPLDLILSVALGVAAALLSAVHVRLIGATTAIFRRVPPTVRAASIGGAVGLLAWFAPSLVGPGGALTQSVLDGQFAVSALVLILLVRFVLGPISIAAATPGGYFTPVLVLGAAFGAIVGLAVVEWIPASSITPTGFAVVGMGVALATVTRAPVTGILLTMETTGAFPMLLPMTLAVSVAALVTRGLDSPTLDRVVRPATWTQGK